MGTLLIRYTIYDILDVLGVHNIRLRLGRIVGERQVGGRVADDERKRKALCLFSVMEVTSPHRADFAENVREAEHSLLELARDFHATSAVYAIPKSTTSCA